MIDYLLIFTLYLFGYVFTINLLPLEEKPIKTRLLAILFGVLCAIILHPRLNRLAIHLENKIQKEEELRQNSADSTPSTLDSLKQENKRLRDEIELLK